MIIVALVVPQALPEDLEGGEQAIYRNTDLSLYMGGATTGGEAEPMDFRLTTREGVECQAFELAKPRRLVVDVLGLKLDRHQVIDVVQNPWVRRVRIGLHEDKTRIVVDVKGTAAISLIDQGSTKIFRLDKEAREPVSAEDEEGKRSIPVVTPEGAAGAEARQIVVESSALTPTPVLAATALPSVPATISPTALPIAAPTAIPSPTIAVITSSSPAPTAESVMSFTPAFSPTVALELSLESDSALKQVVPATPAVVAVRRRSIVVHPAEEAKTAAPAATVPGLLETTTPLPDTTVPAPRPTAVDLVPGDSEQDKPGSSGGFGSGIRNMQLTGVDVSGFSGSKNIKIPNDRLQELARVPFTVDKVLIPFKAGERPIQNLNVRNPGLKQIFVTAVPQLVRNEGTPEESREDTQELLVSPRRFAIDPGSDRNVRVVLKELPPDRERVYNIAFSVNKDSFEAEFIDIEVDGKLVRLRVITNLGVLVLAEPPSPSVLLGSERTADEILFANRGTVSVRLTAGKVCRNAGGMCIPISPRRLYPGNTWTLKLSRDWSVFFIKESVLGFEQYFVPSE